MALLEMSLKGNTLWSDIVSEPPSEPPAVVVVARRMKPRRFRVKRIVVMNMDTFIQTVMVTHREDTTDQVKAKIQVKFGIPPEQQRLMFRTNPVADGVIWNQLQFEQGEAVLHVSDVRSMQVFVKDLDGNTCVIDCVPTLTVECMKARILALLSMQTFVPEQLRLTFAGRRLENFRLLCDYGVEDESSVHVSLNIDGGMSLPPHRGLRRRGGGVGAGALVRERYGQHR
jgi:hypothetical protein